tara:strand:- start:93 stop:449 length:357 start_codon:yes stop_codon:yes gene_type:complete
MIGFGSANFNQGTFGKGVIQSYGIIASTSSVAGTFGIAQWESTHTLSYSSSVVLTFGGLIQGATGYMQGTSTMYSYPVFTWAGFGDLETEQSTISSFGQIAWDGQLVPDSTWTNQIVD